MVPEPTTLRAADDAQAAGRCFAENPEVRSNERLEFLGDAVLGLAVTDHVYATYPDLPEGELAKLRASVVNAEVSTTAGAARSRVAPVAGRTS